MSSLSFFKKVVQKQLGPNIFNYNININKCSSGSLKLDSYIGNGIPMGRCCEIYGPEASGKTTLATLICIEFQRQFPDKAVGYLDLEQVFNHEYAKNYGLDYNEDRFLFVQPSSADEALDVALKMLDSGLFSIVVIDSVAAMQTKRQIEGDIGDATIGEVARLLSATMPKIIKSAKNTDTTIIFINQLRSAIGVYSPTGSPTTTPGGKALKYFSSLRLEVKRKGFIVSGDNILGQELICVIRKNKYGRNHGQIDLSLLYNIGFKKENEIADLALEVGIIEQKGPWVYYKDNKWNGKKVLTEAILNDKELFESIYSDYILKQKEISETIDIQYSETDSEEDNEEAESE